MSFDGGGASLGSAEGRILITTDAAQANVRQLQGAIGDFGKSADGAFRQVATGIGLLATSRKLGSIFTGAIGDAGDFEQAVANVNAVADLTATQLDQVRQEALQLGKDTKFSATEAANAMEELVKAGVSVEDVLNGAASGAVALAAAGGIGVADAAAEMAVVLNEFGLAGTDASHVADLLAGAANASAASVQSLGDGLKYVGATAHSLNIPLEDTITALAILEDRGLDASTAGTSLNQAILSVVAPTQLAADAMTQYGISVQDASGNFVGVPNLIDQITAATQGMGDVARTELINTIFGDRGGRAIIALMDAEQEGIDGTGKSWDDYSAEVNKAGAAQDVAAKRMDTFQGSIEQMRGSLETVGIAIGTHFLPAARDLVDAITSILNIFLTLPGSVQTLSGILVGGAAAITGIAGAMVLAGPKAAAFGDALTAIRTAILGVNPLLLAGAVAVGLLIAAYKTNFGGFADFINGIGKRISDTFSSITKDLHFFTTDFNGIQIKRSWGRAIGIDQLTRIQHVLQNMGRTFNKFNKDMDKVGAGFSRIGRVFKRNGFIAGLQATFGDTGQGILSNFVKAFAAIPETVGKALRGIRTGLAPIDRMFYDAGRALQFFGGALEALATGDFRTAFAKLAASLSSLLDVGRNAAQLAIDGLRKAASSIEGVAVAIGSWAISQGPPLIDAVIDFVTNVAWPAVKDKASDILDVAVNIASWAVRAGASIFDAVSATIAAAWDLLRDHAVDIGSALVSIGSFVVSAASGIFDAVSGAIQAAWNLLKSHAVDLESVLVSIGSFVISAGTSVFGAVSGTILAAWNLIKDHAVALGDVLVSIGAFVVSAGAGIFDTVSGAVQAAWELVKDAAVPIHGVLLDIQDFAVAEFSSGLAWSADAITSIQAWIDGNPPGSFVTAINLTDFNVAFAAGAQGRWADAVIAVLTADPIVITPEIDLEIQQSVENALRGNDQAVSDQESQDFWHRAFAALTRPDNVLTNLQGDLNQIARDIHVGIRDALFQDRITIDPVTGQLILDKSLSRRFRDSLRAFFDDLGSGVQQDTQSFSDRMAADIQSLADRITASLPGVGSAIVNASKAIAGFFVDLFTWGDDVHIQFPDLVSPITGWFGEQIANLRSSLAGAIPDWMGDLARGDLLALARDIGGGGDQQPDPVDTGPLGPNSTTNPFKDSDGDGIPDSIDPSPPPEKFLQVGNDLGAALGDGIALGLASKKKAVDAALLDLLKPPPQTETNDSKSTDFHVKNPSAVNFPAPNLAALTRGFADAVNATQDAIRRIVGVVNTLTPQFGNAVQNAMRAFVSALSNGLASAVNNTQTAVSRIIGNANTLISALGNAGANAGRAFSANVSAAMFGAVTVAANAASALVGAVAGRLSGLGGLGYGIGQQLGFGMANGIASTISAVVSAAVNLVYSALAAARFAALIGSPSKLFAREVGEPIAQGMAVGIDDGHGAVKHSIASLIAAAIPTVSATSLASSPTSHAATLLAQPTAAAVSLGARSNVVNQNTFTLKTEFHGITDTDEIETRVHTSFFRAIDLAASAGLFGS